MEPAESRAKKLLSQERFWGVIEQSLLASGSPTSDQQEERLEEQLEELSEDEFTGFVGHFWLRQREAYRNDLWAVAYVVMGGCSDDCFSDFRTWLVARGKDAYVKALEEPDSLCEEFRKIPEGGIPLWEYFLHVPYDRRFGSGACNRAYGAFGFVPEELLDPQNTWRHEDEQSVSRLCPAVFREFWNNDRF